jgi:hypothetical protein
MFEGQHSAEHMTHSPAVCVRQFPLLSGPRALSVRMEVIRVPVSQV